MFSSFLLFVINILLYIHQLVKICLSLFVSIFKGNSMAFHHKVKFSTKDQDNEKVKGGCAKRLKGAWWHDYCGHSSLNGEYIRGGGYAGHNKGINWQKWKGDNYSMKSASMMLRRT
jgi:hypothetical protein